MTAATDTAIEQLSQAGSFIAGIIVGAVIVVAVLRNLRDRE